MKKKENLNKSFPELDKHKVEFIQDRASDLTKFRSYLKEEDFTQIKKMTHKWQGFCAPYGFHHLETLSQQLETAANQQSLSKSAVILDKMSEYIQSRKNDFAQSSNGK